MIRFSICGAASYACGELLRLMVNHPETQVAHLAAGRRIQDEHPALMGFYDQEILPLNDETIAQIVEDSDVVFTAVDAGTVCGIAEKVLAGGKKFIDFGADIRFRDAKVWEKWYHLDHPNYEMTKEAVYCIPEIQRDLAKGKSLISNPGCYPTATTLGLYPALKEGLVVENTIVVDAKSGYTGAGRRPAPNKLLAEASNSFCAYALGGSHRHTPEIEQNIAYLTGKDLMKSETWQFINFQPHLTPLCHPEQGRHQRRAVRDLSALLQGRVLCPRVPRQQARPDQVDRRHQPVLHDAHLRRPHQAPAGQFCHRQHR